MQGNLTVFGVLTAAVDLKIQYTFIPKTSVPVPSTEFSLQFGEDRAHAALGKEVRETVVSSLKTAKDAALYGINYRQVTQGVTFCGQSTDHSQVAPLCRARHH